MRDQMAKERTDLEKEDALMNPRTGRGGGTGVNPSAPANPGPKEDR
jgi:hypothetical protein